MLYLRWLETSRRFASKPAVFDGAMASTFEELARAVEAAPRTDGPVVARTGGLSFLIDTLRAWRDGVAVVPVEKDAPEPLLHRQPPSGIALVKHTPGASGIPRGIFLTGAQVAADADRLVAAMELDPQVPNLAVVSLSHSYGFSNVVLPLVLHGIPVRMVPVPFPRIVEEAFRAHESVVLPAVPSMWRAWQRAGILKGAPVRLALSAGAPLALPLEIEVFERSGLKIRNFYGASECGGIALDLGDAPRESADLMGTPLPGVRVEASAAGRLLVSSDAVAEGYEVSREDDLLENTRYLTRDTGFVDERGLLHLTGTTGSAINVAGRKVSPAKVEAAILATGLVRSVRVQGIPSADPERCEEISARVELAPGASLGALRSAAARSLQSWEVPRHWS